MFTLSDAALSRHRLGAMVAVVAVAALMAAGCGSSKDTFKATSTTVKQGPTTTRSQAGGEAGTTTTSPGGPAGGATTTTGVPGGDGVGPPTTEGVPSDPSLDSLLLGAGEVGAGWKALKQSLNQDLVTFCDGVKSPTTPTAYRVRSYNKGKDSSTNLLYTGLVRFKNDADAGSYLHAFPGAAKKCGDKFINAEFKPLAGVGDEALRGQTGGVDFVAFRTGADVGIVTLVSISATTKADAIAGLLADKVKAG